MSTDCMLKVEGRGRQHGRLRRLRKQMTRRVHETQREDYLHQTISINTNRRRNRTKETWQEVTNRTYI